MSRLLYTFRAELFSHPRRASEYPDLRFAHTPVLGNVGVEGIRLTELARRAQLSLAACSELVDDLQKRGYLERRPDPSDRRAKLIFPTKRGRRLLDETGRAIAEIEQRWRQLLPPGEFDRACYAVDRLLSELDRQDRPGDTAAGHANRPAGDGGRISRTRR
ncbi:MarR family winged helix-turn-helix transcriptional regulator [Pseudonocardia acaciae]|uniref:MarR family winged helix-turn-helix transcriptional regulator n=1 Tax=Pseudonocardia acaciae TaxID=551276 RepID=UPI001B7FFE43|nr:MarR family transcriptional regulator [Pseudonocardia acaciae]